MHCSRFAREFLHFLHIFCRSADARQAIEFTPLFDFLHLMHFLQAVPLAPLIVAPVRLNAAGRDDQPHAGAGWHTIG
jgi:hypothetical protein